jgi:uncharacterized membrane protein
LPRGNPNPAFAVFWAISFVILVIAGVWCIYRSRVSRSKPEWDVLLFSILVPLVAVVGYYLFLGLLSYLARP